MQSGKQVRVVEVDADGSNGRPVGQVEFVEADTVVLSMSGRADIPTLPLRVLVPVAAGGDRDEHQTVEVTEVVPADGEPYVALRLAQPITAGDEGARAQGLMSGGMELSATESATTRSRFCRLFPWICG